MRNLTTTLCLTIAVLVGTHAQAGTYSCEVKRVEGSPETLKIRPYSEIGVSLIIDRRTSKITYSYAEHGRRWESKFKIFEENEDAILGIEHFGLDTMSVILFNKKEKILQDIYMDPGGNTLSFGKCFD